ncbi:hypothetical protein BC6307_07155 [Sutcliffiella cohnii]|uniref:Uncharacterized protein n=1 Tax=Sutcliffiella cohnii TaxID=33932 RepID=A0A223KNJ3_9BACI|nr:hypothetical protein [Sutcliffiella cohnii]AST91070.1 hypothetical protein BC6307_07155 [Sutcliffiella cohnii]
MPKNKGIYLFLYILGPVSKELEFVARELEKSVFTRPRTMLTHARVFVENILQLVMKVEGFIEVNWMTLKVR